MPQTAVKTLERGVLGNFTNTGSQTSVTAREASRRIKTHLLGRDEGFSRRQIVPRRSMFTDTETETTAKSPRNVNAAKVAVSTRELWHRFCQTVENGAISPISRGPVALKGILVKWRCYANLEDWLPSSLLRIGWRFRNCFPRKK